MLHSEWCNTNKLSCGGPVCCVPTLLIFSFSSPFFHASYPASPGDTAKHVSATSHPKDKKALREEVICLDDSSTSVGEEGSKSDGPTAAPAERTRKTGQGHAGGSPPSDLHFSAINFFLSGDNLYCALFNSAL